jgi:hypothetical protein
MDSIMKHAVILKCVGINGGVTTRKNPGLSVTLIAVQLNVPFVDT